MLVYHSGDHTPNPAAGALLHRLEIQQGIGLKGRQTESLYELYPYKNVTFDLCVQYRLDLLLP